MSADVRQIDYSFPLGYYPDQPEFGGIPGTARRGGGYWKRGPGLWISDFGETLVGNSGGANPLQNVGGQHGGMTGGSGSVILHLGLPWYAGSGNAVLNGAVIGASTGRLMVVIGGIALVVGIVAPGTPQLNVNGGAASAQMVGSFSLRTTAFRQLSGGESNMSPVSNVVALNGKKIKVDSFGSIPPEATHLRFYCPPRQFGSVGPHRLVRTLGDVPVASCVSGFEFDYFDGDLGAEGPLANDPPLPCTHCAALGEVMIALGALGGYAIQPSRPGYPEAFDPRQTSFLAVREAITGVNGRATDGVIYVSTRNSLSMIIPTGSRLTPVLPRGYWESTGFAHGNAWCITDRGIYGYSGGPVRTQGGEAPDRSFGEPVKNYMKAIGFTDDNARVIFAPDQKSVYFCAGNIAIPFNLTSNDWSADMVIPGSVTAGIMLNGVGLVGVGSSLYSLNTGGGGGAFSLRSAHFGPPNGDNLARMTLKSARVRTNAATTANFYKRGAAGPVSVGGKYPASVSAPNGSHIQSNQAGLRDLAFEISGSGGGKEFYGAAAEVEIEPQRV